MVFNLYQNNNMQDNLRILHLEDVPSDALLVSRALKQAGFKFDCRVVDTKEGFLVALKDFDPDLILADHSLPSFNSFEALELLGSLENKIPVILVTATMSDEFAVNAIKRGARDYVLKDRLKRLPSAIKNVLETQRIEKEREGFLVQLQQNERKFRRLIEHGADAVVILLPDGTPSYVTPSLKRVLGYSEKEALELNMYEIIHENQRECVLEKLKECLVRPQIPFDGNSVRARHKDGSWRWLDVTLTSFMEDSTIEGIVADFRDVTEKKKLEELLDEASRFARFGTFEIDCEKDILYWSPVTKEIHEVEMEFVPTAQIGINFYKEGESRNAISNAYLKAFKENTPYDLELQLVTAKGRERWVRSIGQPTFVGGKCVRINGSFQDITNIKNSELKALKASEEKEIILESIGDAFFMVDKDWTVTYWNRHSEKLLDCPRDKILGKNLWKVFSDAIGTKFEISYQKAVKEQSIENFEEYFERAQKWFEVTAYPSNSGLSVYFRDVTERKKSELQIMGLNSNLKAHTEELVEANKGLEQFSFIVSHNLRSPVANILGLADLIGNKDYPEEVKNDFLEALIDNVKRLDIVISDLNAILQVKVEMDAKKEPVQLSDLVDAIKTSIQNLLEKEKVQITTHFDVPAIHTVQSYLHSIFYNLIANSIKYRRPGIPPKIWIRSETIEGSVVITFEDNGLGIDLVKKRKQVFGLYKRFHHHIEGKGMGLFLVKTQVELLGGKISIESKVNAGTKFTITFKEKTINYIFEHEKETALYGG